MAGGAGLPGDAEGRLAVLHISAAPLQRSHWMEGISIQISGVPDYGEIHISVLLLLGT